MALTLSSRRGSLESSRDWKVRFTSPFYAVACLTRTLMFGNLNRKWVDGSNGKNRCPGSCAARNRVGSFSRALGTSSRNGMCVVLFGLSLAPRCELTRLAFLQIKRSNISSPAQSTLTASPSTSTKSQPSAPVSPAEE